MPWILQRQEKGCYSTSLTDLIHPGYQIFFRMPLPFYLIKECIHHHIKKSVTNFRKLLEVGLRLAITLRHQATGETYTSLEYHWLIGCTTIYKFVPRSAEPSQLNFRKNICTALIALMNGKVWRSSNQMECPPCCRCHRRKAYRHKEAKENR